MADIELVIKIPEVFYEALRKTDMIVSEQRSGKTLMSVIYNAVAKGTPLPKGHGRLLDEKDILNTGANGGWCYDLVDMPEYIADVKEVIEADTTESEG